MGQVDRARADRNRKKKGHGAFCVHILSFLFQIYLLPTKICHYGSEQLGANESHWIRCAQGNIYDETKLTAEKIYLYKEYDSQYPPARIWHL